MRELFGIQYSPWTLKARWALNANAVPYAYKEYLILIGEPYLRFRSQKWQGKVSVPMLFDGAKCVQGALEIAEYAETIGSGANLFPTEYQSQIRQLNTQLEEALLAARSLVVAKTLESKDAQRASLPSFLPEILKEISTPVARLGANFIARKYHTLRNRQAAEEKLREAIHHLQEQRFEKRYLFGDQFSFGDIAACALVQCIQPVDNRYLPIADALREIWSIPTIAQDYPSVIAWRNQLFQDHYR